MISNWHWLLRQLTRTLWIRAALLAVLAIATALLAIVADRFVPFALPTSIGQDAVDRVLGILASSMLAVTTFSLSTMVAAYGAATTNVTPRATRLLMQDSTTQNVLATFIGSFLFSLVGIIALSVGAYGEKGRSLLFVVTIAVIGLVVITILRWVEHLSRLGRVAETTQRVEEATAGAIRFRVENPFLGGVARRPDEPLPAGARPVMAGAIGYVRHIDMGALQGLADDSDAPVVVLALPGTLVHPGRPLAALVRPDEERTARLRGAFIIGDQRDFDQDPRFGLCVLAEIASRALSPALNDPGTAMDVLTRGLRLLSGWRVPSFDKDKVTYPGVHASGLDADDLLDDFFTPVARDGAAIIEVQLLLQKVLRILAGNDPESFGDSARRHAAAALRRCAEAGMMDDDLARLRALPAMAAQE